MTGWQRFQKRALDVVVSGLGLIVVGPIIGVAILVARRSTGLSGLFRQQRVGLNGELFTALKIRSMRPIEGFVTTVTTDVDPRITRAGRFFRKTKIDELPQLINVFFGDMSLVGPRPDVPAQIALTAEPDRAALLSMRPGVTGPASVKYRDEEELLAASDDPQKLNDNVIWPDKVRINLEYRDNWSIATDLYWMFQTVFPATPPATYDSLAVDSPVLEQRAA